MSRLRLLVNEHKYVIRCTNGLQLFEGTGIYWSNELGWCDFDEADRFTKEETKTVNLPLDGEWLDTHELSESMNRHPVSHRRRSFTLVSDETPGPTS